MIIPALPEAVHIRRNAHGFTHSFSHLQMDAYGRECANAALDDVADKLEQVDLSALKDDPQLLVYTTHLVMGLQYKKQLFLKDEDYQKSYMFKLNPQNM